MIHDTSTSVLARPRERAPKLLPPRRTAPFSEEPGFHEPAGLWFYGNVGLLKTSLAFVQSALGAPDHGPKKLKEIEQDAESLVLQGRILVCGIHNVCHMRAAVVPLRWGSPRVVVFSGGFQFHLGENLDQEPFLSATLWRTRWDPVIDLAVSRRAPEKPPTFARYNPTVDKLVARIAVKRDLGLLV